MRIRLAGFGIFIVIVTAVVGLSPCAALARQAEIVASVDEALQPDFIRRDLAVMQREMKTDAAQSVIVESLFEDYENAFRAAAEQVRQETMRLRPAVGMSDPNMERQREELRERVTALLEETRRLHENSPDADAAELQRQFQQKAEQLRDEFKHLQMDALTEEDARAIVQQSLAALDRWQAEKSRLGEKFVGDLLTTLSEEQRSLWPRVEQQLYREKSLPRGRLSGESVDLFAVVRELRLTPEQFERIKLNLERYASRLDHALHKRNEFFIAARRQLFEAMAQGERSVVESLVARHVQTRAAVRNVNDEAAREIAAMLEQPLNDEFTNAYRSRAYSRVFRPTRTQRMLNSASERYGSDAALVQAMSDLNVAYQADIAAVNERLLRLVQKLEPDEICGLLLQHVRNEVREVEPAGEDALSAEYTRRQELEDRYQRRLQGLLNPEQFSQLTGK